MEPGLPSEIISSILKLAAKPTVVRELSTGLKHVSKLDVLETVCNRPINRAELDKYTEGGRVFGFIINPLINIEEIVQYSYI